MTYSTRDSSTRSPWIHAVLGFFTFAGTQPVGLIDFDDALLARSRCHSTTLSLQVAAAARLAGDQNLELPAVSNFHHRALEGSL